jgi:hypothetical protein
MQVLSKECQGRLYALIVVLVIHHMVAMTMLTPLDMVLLLHSQDTTLGLTKNTPRCLLYCQWVRRSLASYGILTLPVVQVYG